MNYPIGEREQFRLKVLKEMAILDTIEEASFDEITAMTSLIFSTPTVTVSLLDEHRQWFKSHHGLDVCETERDIAFCNYTVMSDQIFEVVDPQNDTRFKDNPLVTGDFNLRYYCGAPIIVKGETIGAFCLLDYFERSPLTKDQRTILQGLANIVTEAIANRHLLKKSAAMLAEVMNNLSHPD